jgi:hypothetical protein
MISRQRSSNFGNIYYKNNCNGKQNIQREEEGEATSISRGEQYLNCVRLFFVFEKRTDSAKDTDVAFQFLQLMSQSL